MLILTNSTEYSENKNKLDLFNNVNPSLTKNDLLITPTNRSVRELKYLQIEKNGLNLTNNIFTLETLIRRVFSAMKINYFEIGQDIQSVLVEEAIIKLSKEKRLLFFTSRKDGKIQKGVFEKIFKIIKEFKEIGLYVSELEKDLNIIDKKEINKALDIIHIYQEYEISLNNRFVDKGEIFKIVNDKFVFPLAEDYFRAVFPLIKNVYIFGFSEFSQPEIKFLSTLSTIKELNINFIFDYNSTNPFLFGIMKQNVDSFYDLNFKEVVLSTNNKNELQKHLSENLFCRNKQKNKLDFTTTVTLFSAKDRLKEVEYITKIIKDIILKNPDQNLSKICVATNQTDNYADLFREYFDKYGLPVNITDRYNLDQSHLISAFVSFLQIPINNYRKKEIFRALLSPYMVFIKPNKEKVNTNLLFEIANNLKISYGKNNWIERIDYRIKSLKDKKDVEDDLKIKEEIKKLNIAKTDFEFIVSLLEPLNKKHTPLEYEKLITDLIRKLKISEQILLIEKNSYSNIFIEKDFRALNSFFVTLKNISAFYELKTTDDKICSLKEYLYDLKIAISNTRYNIKQKNEYGILVTAAEETRGLDFDYMFLAGVIEGEFPPLYRPEIFKPEIRRKTEEKHYLESRYLFYQTITNFQKKLFISYPQYNNDSELLPSSFLAALKDIIIFNEDISSFTDNKIFSKIELQTFLGNIIKNNADSQFINSNLIDDINKLKHKSKLEESRTKTHNFVEYEGIIYNNINDKCKKDLENYLEKYFSINELEEYGKCPMSYFFSRVIKIETIEDLDDTITPLEFGSLLHDTLFEFFTNWKLTNDDSFYSKKIKNNPLEIENQLISIAKKKANELNITNPFFHIDFFKIIGEKNKKGILSNFIAYELNEKNKKLTNTIEKDKTIINFEPEFFEISFGKEIKKGSCDSKLSTNTPITLGNVFMKGQIDRIDLFNDGKNIFFVIFDYKTGKTRATTSDINIGSSLQLPIYVACTQKLLKEKLEILAFPIAASYYTLNNIIKITIPIYDPDYIKGSNKSIAFNDIIDKSVEYINQYVTNISNGLFGYPNFKNIKNTCEYCNYTTICRINCIKLLDNNN
jgi:ATP-dependent helicase/nuclease subunit B